jgi:hypothetical protein
VVSRGNHTVVDPQEECRAERRQLTGLQGRLHSQQNSLRAGIHAAPALHSAGCSFVLSQEGVNARAVTCILWRAAVAASRQETAKHREEAQSYIVQLSSFGCFSIVSPYVPCNHVLSAW